MWHSGPLICFVWLSLACPCEAMPCGALSLIVCCLSVARLLMRASWLLRECLLQHLFRHIARSSFSEFPLCCKGGNYDWQLVDMNGCLKERGLTTHVETKPDGQVLAAQTQCMAIRR